VSLRATLDPVAREATGDRLYLAYTLEREHVLTLDPAVWSLESLRNHLLQEGYERSPSVGPVPLEAAKRHPETGATHDLALRKVGGDADETHVTAIMADDPRHTQFHVHAFERGDGIELHSHFEWRPDPTRLHGETWTDAYHRLRSHYRPGSYGDGAYLRRVACPVVKSLKESA